MYTCIYMYIVCIYIFPSLSLNGAVEQLYTVVKGVLDILETIKYVLKKMVFMFSYPKSTEEVMVVRNKWNFDHNL